MEFLSTGRSHAVGKSSDPGLVSSLAYIPTLYTHVWCCLLLQCWRLESHGQRLHSQSESRESTSTFSRSENSECPHYKMLPCIMILVSLHITHCIHWQVSDMEVSVSTLGAFLSDPRGVIRETSIYQNRCVLLPK